MARTGTHWDVFGCGESLAPGPIVFSPDAAQRAFGQGADHLRHTAGLDRDTLDQASEGVAAAQSLPLGDAGVFGLLGGSSRQLTNRSKRNSAFVSDPFGAGSAGGGAGGTGLADVSQGRIHTVPSTAETVRLGVFDATLPELLEIDSGDIVVYPDTWSHFHNRLQPGTQIGDLARLRRENPGRGPHSIVGPVGVRGAEPGDMLAIHFQRLRPVDWGATFVNPGDLGTGTLADEFPVGQVRYLQLDGHRKVAEFLPGIEVPLAPFQGTFAVAPAQGGAVSSVPPGQHAGNIDLRELTEGSVLYVPVWQPTGKLYTGDSHAAQGDGEVNNQAVESAMREVRVQVILHKHAGWAWPFAETTDHWIAMGIDADLNAAFRIATRNTIELFVRKAGLTPLDAYSLSSIGVSFRVTQFVNQTRGVHAMIPKTLFSAQRRAEMSIV